VTASCSRAHGTARRHKCAGKRILTGVRRSVGIVKLRIWCVTSELRTSPAGPLRSHGRTFTFNLRPAFLMISVNRGSADLSVSISSLMSARASESLFS
jgi:hypothetical protein